ncbi:type II toxin-antitoxin system VapC family toxin [Vreelandella sulfidaeris]|uniref:Twitching motility protein PilT n=1 Tax=Vreelandella sulfidaeris TaxID=115553 RepID=A0A455UF34_9GAMM|nr:twitching motility protein PilT [Halomonas sulfidaeris]
MRLLLDTNIIIWLLAGDERINSKVSMTLDDAEEVRYSAVSLWEIAIKSGNGKLRINASGVMKNLEGTFIKTMPILPQHTLPVQNMPKHHADPFDRLLIAQATVEGMTLLTGDRALKRYDSTGRVVRLISDL